MMRCRRFGAEQATPVLVLRDYLRTGVQSESLLTIPTVRRPADLKPAEDGDGVILRCRMCVEKPRRFPFASRWVSPSPRYSPLEEDAPRCT